MMTERGEPFQLTRRTEEQYDYAIVVRGDLNQGKTLLCTRLENIDDPPTEIERRYLENVDVPRREYYYPCLPLDESGQVMDVNTAPRTQGPESRFTRFQLVDLLQPPSNASVRDAQATIVVINALEHFKQFQANHRSVAELQAVVELYVTRNEHTLVVFTWCVEALLNDALFTEFQAEARQLLQQAGCEYCTWIDLKTAESSEIRDCLVALVEMVAGVPSRAGTRRNSLAEQQSEGSSNKKSCSC